MIRAIPTTNEQSAKDYFVDALQPTGYFVNSQELQGEFFGKIAHRLGINGPTDRDTFFALCSNINPVTRENLTPRTKEKRAIFYDVSFHAPKSVSLIHCLSADNHILTVFEKTVRDTMLEMENDMLTRVRRNGKDEDRHSGEMMAASFVHQTARPANGAVSDPHLHCHNLIWSVAYDKVEGRYKAGQFLELMRGLPYYQARFHKRLGDHLLGLGYKIRKTKTSFEIESVPVHLIDLFSKRSNQIGQFAKEHGITDAKTLDQLGARTRGAKQKDLSMNELRDEWRKQIREASTGKEDFGDVIVRHKEKIVSPRLEAQSTIDYAAKDRFERLSTISDRRLLEAAYRHSVGNNSVSLDEIDNAFHGDERFIRLKDGFQTICTMKEVLSEEKEMVTLARNGQNRFRPLYAELPNIALEGQQKTAVENILSTPHMVSIVRGAAGVGKTTMLRELDKHIKASGKEPLYTAPTAQAVREVLMKEGFVNSETVAQLLTNPELQNRLQNQILIVDEAGLIGTGQMRDLLALATRKNARVLLTGDPNQHSAILRGDALRVLTNIGKIKPAEISKIRRQRDEKYRAAVQDLADGNVNSAFGKLDEIEAIRQIDPLNPNAELVADYIQKAKRGKSLLVISPTHQQGASVTEDIRRELKTAGLIGKKETQALKLINLNFTEAQKGDRRNYKSGYVVQFDLPAPEIKRASVWRVKEVGDRIVLKDKAGYEKILPLDKAKAFSVYEPSEINLAKGDKVRVTKNGSDRQEKRLNNGQTFEVVSFNKSGQITCRNKESKATYILDGEYGHIDHAYCTTSHSSQGKSCDEVLISMPGSVFPATDQKLFYVAVSRGRDMVTIYTDDKEQLLEHAERSGDRLSALELVEKSKKQAPRINRGLPIAKAATYEKEKSFTPLRKLDYEP